MSYCHEFHHQNIHSQLSETAEYHLPTSYLTFTALLVDSHYMHELVSFSAAAYALQSCDTLKT